MTRRPDVVRLLYTAVLCTTIFSVEDLSARAAPLIRFPTASGSKVAFVAKNDLWTVPLHGGVAHRLTQDAGAISTALFSPDGDWIAFTARRAGLRDVFVIPSAGGVPKRLTFEATPYPDGALVAAWTPDSQSVVFLSHRCSTVSKLLRAFSVPRTGGMPEPLPMDRSGELSFSSDGHEIAFNRNFRNLEFRKRYIGGAQQDLFLYNLDTNGLQRLTDWKGTDTFPMWHDRKIYFVSDRGADWRQNLWSIDLNSKAVHQVTAFRDFDVDWPSLTASTITFQQGGRLWAVDLPSEKLREIPVSFPTENQSSVQLSAALARIARVTDVMGQVDYSLSPDGNKLLFSAGGELFTLTASSRPSNLTETPAVDEDHAAWSPDGHLIAYESDAQGSQQLAIRSSEGGPERTLTHFRTGYFYTPVWSPLGDRFVVADANHSLWCIFLDRREPQRLAFDPYAEIRDASFSPDGRWIAYSTERDTQLRAIHLQDLSSGLDTVVSSEMESDRSPVFTKDGQYLVFLSQRNEQTFVSDRDDENLIATLNSDGLYAVALQREAPPLTSSPDKPSEGPSNPIVQIDLNGLMDRAVPLSVTPAHINSLRASASALFFETQPIQLVGGESLRGEKGALHRLDLVGLTDRVLVEGEDNFALSGDGNVIAFRRAGDWHLIDAKAKAPKAPLLLSLDAVRAPVANAGQWPEMFENAWRLDRDVFFSQVMNGTNWQEVHDAYKQFLPLVATEEDFVYLLGQMQGEIASSHTFIDPLPLDESHAPIRTGLLGVDYVLDRKAGRFRFEKIFHGDATRPAMRGPLAAPGLNVHEGDYLLSVNGRELKTPASPDELMAGLTEDVTITVADTATGHRRQITVTPITDDLRLRRHDWIEDNRGKVNRLSSGHLGYIFLTDFNAEGSADFVRQFYPQRNKEGLILDVRWNRGGFTSQSVLDVLRRRLAGVFVNREGALTDLPNVVGPTTLVTITNEASASDGDQFPYFFRQYGLGTIVGERTWGGVQGINRDWVLMNGTPFTIPKDSLASLNGHWIIENFGVEPDIEVTPSPTDDLQHRDVQLEAAIAKALKQLAESPLHPKKTPDSLPAYPENGNVPGASFQRLKH